MSKGCVSDPSGNDESTLFLMSDSTFETYDSTSSEDDYDPMDFVPEYYSSAYQIGMRLRGIQIYGKRLMMAYSDGYREEIQGLTNLEKEEVYHVLGAVEKLIRQMNKHWIRLVIRKLKRKVNEIEYSGLVKKFFTHATSVQFLLFIARLRKLAVKEVSIECDLLNMNLREDVLNSLSPFESDPSYQDVFDNVMKVMNQSNFPNLVDYIREVERISHLLEDIVKLLLVEDHHLLQNHWSEQNIGENLYCLLFQKELFESSEFPFVIPTSAMDIIETIHEYQRILHSDPGISIEQRILEDFFYVLHCDISQQADEIQCKARDCYDPELLSWIDWVLGKLVEFDPSNPLFTDVRAYINVISSKNKKGIDLFELSRLQRQTQVKNDSIAKKKSTGIKSALKKIKKSLHTKKAKSNSTNIPFITLQDIMLQLKIPIGYQKKIVSLHIIRKRSELAAKKIS